MENKEKKLTKWLRHTLQIKILQKNIIKKCIGKFTCNLRLGVVLPDDRDSDSESVSSEKSSHKAESSSTT